MSTGSSPCTGRCCLQDSVCTGCGRTLDEIRRWSRMTNNERKQVNERIRDGGFDNHGGSTDREHGL